MSVLDGFRKADDIALGDAPGEQSRKSDLVSVVLVEPPARHDVEGPAVAVIVAGVSGEDVDVRATSAYTLAALPQVRRSCAPLGPTRAFDRDGEASPGHVDAVSAALGLDCSGQRVRDDGLRVRPEGHAAECLKPPETDVDESALDW